MKDNPYKMDNLQFRFVLRSRSGHSQQCSWIGIDDDDVDDGKH